MGSSNYPESVTLTDETTADDLVLLFSSFATEDTPRIFWGNPFYETVVASLTRRVSPRGKLVGHTSLAADTASIRRCGQPPCSRSGKYEMRFASQLTQQVE